MKIIRYLDSSGNVKFASLRPDKTALVISGDVFGGFSVTDEPAQVEKLLAPVAPASLLCIGLNYRRHAEEGKAQIPEFPVLFMKAPSSVQNPGDPILLPRHLRSDEVDYECELAVVIGRACKNVSRQRALDYVLGLHLRQRRERPRLAAPLGRRPVVPRKDLRHVRAAGPLPGHRRRDSPAERPGHQAGRSAARCCKTGTPAT